MVIFSLCLFICQSSLNYGSLRVIVIIIKGHLILLCQNHGRWFVYVWIMAPKFDPCLTRIIYVHKVRFLILFIRTDLVESSCLHECPLMCQCSFFIVLATTHGTVMILHWLVMVHLTDSLSSLDRPSCGTDIIVIQSLVLRVCFMRLFIRSALNPRNCQPIVKSLRHVWLLVN